MTVLRFRGWGRLTACPALLSGSKNHRVASGNRASKSDLQRSLQHQRVADRRTHRRRCQIRIHDSFERAKLPRAFLRGIFDREVESCPVATNTHRFADYPGAALPGCHLHVSPAVAIPWHPQGVPECVGDLI